MPANKKEVMTALYPHFAQNEKMVLLAGDMGFAVLDDFFRHKERAFNTGIAEQATISMAAGMAMAGLFPVVYSQIPFLIMRAFEQLRYDLNEHRYKVLLIGVGADNYFEKLGRSHCMDSDDIPLIEMLNAIQLLSPEPGEAEAAVKNALDYPGPSYIRTL